jgi:iron complex outermembrane recepter protein
MIRKEKFTPSLLLSILLSGGVSETAFAEDTSSPTGGVVYRTEDITVFGTSDRQTVDDIIPTVSEISGKNFEKKKQTTLGETLSREAGVSSSFFGPNASRPVIRGLEGERVRVLQNGVGTLDASGASPDHAIPVDPFLVDRVEIVRGSAALLYGNSAVGGVVNTIDSRIPDRLSLVPKLKFQSQYSSVDKGRNAAFRVDGSSGRFAYHFDGVARGTSNYSIPDFARSTRLREDSPLEEGESETRGSVLNSGAKNYEGALGGSFVFDRGYFGASFTGFRSHYGTVAEEAVSILMRRQRLDLAGEMRLDGFIQSVRLKSALSYYKHQEFEGVDVGTTFRNKGMESRIDLKHQPLGPMEGVFGIQNQYSHFNAIGEEAFVPSTRNSSLAAFFYEELKFGDFTPSLGARLDRSGVHSEDDANFGVGEKKDFWASSVSSGVLYKINGEFSTSLNGTLNQRAPNYQELFADGPHVATGIFEVGDRNLEKEKSRSLEVSLRHRTKIGSGRLSAFVQDFSNFVSLSDSGSLDADSELPIYRYTPVRARLFGAEFEYRRELPFRLLGGVFDLEFKFDWLRGRDRTNRTELPRMTPVRESLALGFQHPKYSLEFEAQRSEAQKNLSANELRTDSYTLFNLRGDYELISEGSAGESPLQLFGQLNNLFNAEARNHVSFLKDLAPLPGRNIVIGLRGVL